MVSQSKTESIIETTINIGTGTIVSMLVWQYIAAPLYNIPVTLGQNVGITAIFTVSSVIRSYFWRRFFAIGIHKKIHSLLRRTG